MKWIGIILIFSAMIVWIHSMIELKSNEIMLTTQNLSIEETRAYEGALKWWKNAYVSVYLPTSGILILSGISILSSPYLLGFRQKYTMRKSVINKIEKGSFIQEKVKEKPIVVLHNLISEEANLKKEKKKLASFKEKLQIKVEKEIERKTYNIKKLKSEINDLKYICEELSKSPRNAR